MNKLNEYVINLSTAMTDIVVNDVDELEFMKEFSRIMVDESYQSIKMDNWIKEIKDQSSIRLDRISEDEALDLINSADRRTYSRLKVISKKLKEKVKLNPKKYLKMVVFDAIPPIFIMTMHEKIITTYARKGGVINHVRSKRFRRVLQFNQPK